MFTLYALDISLILAVSFSDNLLAFVAVIGGSFYSESPLLFVSFGKPFPREGSLELLSSLSKLSS